MSGRVSRHTPQTFSGTSTLNEEPVAELLRDETLDIQQLHRVIALRRNFAEERRFRCRDAGRLEVPGGDLHQGGGLNGQLVDLDEARTLVGSEVSA